MSPPALAGGGAHGEATRSTLGRTRRLQLGDGRTAQQLVVGCFDVKRKPRRIQRHVVHRRRVNRELHERHVHARRLERNRHDDERHHGLELDQHIDDGLERHHRRQWRHVPALGRRAELLHAMVARTVERSVVLPHRRVAAEPVERRRVPGARREHLHRPLGWPDQPATQRSHEREHAHALRPRRGLGEPPERSHRDWLDPAGRARQRAGAARRRRLWPVHRPKRDSANWKYVSFK